jgi:RNA recognition motif-containing protein
MQESKLYVGNLSFSSTEEELEALFANYGTVKHVKIIEGRGFGFVEMSNPSEAEGAMEKLNGTEFKGRTLKVAEAHSQKPKQGRSFRKY